MQWYYAFYCQTLGPVSTSVVQNLIREGVQRQLDFSSATIKTGH